MQMRPELTAVEICIAELRVLSGKNRTPWVAASVRLFWNCTVNGKIYADN